MLTPDQIAQARQEFGPPPGQTSPNASPQDAWAAFDARTKSSGQSQFSQNQSSQDQASQSTQPGSLSRIGSDIKNTFMQGVTQGVGDVEKGAAAKTSGESFLAGTHLAGDVAGAAGNLVFGVPARAIFHALPQSFQDATKSTLGSTLDAMHVPELMQHFSDWAAKNPEKAHTAQDIINIASLIPGAKVADEALNLGKEGLQTGKEAAASLTEKAGQAMEDRAAASAENTVERGIKKGIQPSIVGKKSAADISAYMTKAKSAVKSIVDNKENLNLVDDAGNKVELPQNNKQFSEAIGQTKKQIFQKYNAMSKEAGEQGARVQLQGTADELYKIANDEVTQDNHPELAKYAKDKADAFIKRGSYSPEQTEDAIATYNKSLEAFYRNPSYETASRASVDAMIARQFRDGLDKTVESFKGPGYQDLKNQYGALRSIENDVGKRAAKTALKGGGHAFPFLDAASAVELLHGLATMSPHSIATAATMKAGKMALEHLTSPDAYIKRMFKAAVKLK